MVCSRFQLKMKTFLDGHLITTHNSGVGRFFDIQKRQTAKLNVINSMNLMFFQLWFFLCRVWRVTMTACHSRVGTCWCVKTCSTGVFFLPVSTPAKVKVSNKNNKLHTNRWTIDFFHISSLWLWFSVVQSGKHKKNVSHERMMRWPMNISIWILSLPCISHISCLVVPISKMQHYFAFFAQHSQLMCFAARNLLFHFQ